MTIIHIYGSICCVINQTVYQHPECNGMLTKMREVHPAASASVVSSGDTASTVLNTHSARDRALAFPVGWDLEEERWALKEDQRLCRSRARKYSKETNRRRR